MNPFDLPVHPAIVHFPIALLTVAWVARLWAYSFASERWRERSQIMETIGVATLPITVIAGFVDTRGLGFVTEPQWDQPLIWHMLISLTAVAVWTAHWQTQRRQHGRSAAGPVTTRAVVVDLTLMTAGVWLLVLTGAIAGEMVYAV